MAGWGAQHRKSIRPPSARRLRHLRCIVARQLRSPGRDSLPCAFFRLYAGDGEGERDLIYQSETVGDTLNPIWRPLPRSLGEDTTTTQLLVVVHEEGTEAELARAFIELRRAVQVCATVADVPCCPGPTVLFECDDGVFASSSPLEPHVPSVPTLRAASWAPDASAADAELLAQQCEGGTMEPESCPPLVDQTAAQRLCDLQLNATRVVALSHAMESAKRRAAELQKEISTRAEILRRRRELDIRRGFYTCRIAELRRKVAQVEARLPAERQQCAERREQLQERRQELETAGRAVQAKRSRHDALQRRKVQLQQHCAKVERAAALRRQQLVAGLSEIYPIKFDNATQTLAICGSLLHSSDAMATDETAATALGHVAHCVQLLSRIWNVPLRYQVFPIASRSYIKEQYMDPRPAESLQLFYTRGTDKAKYFHAVYLLNKNIRQLLKVRKVGVVDQKRMLYNLQYLLHTEPDDVATDSEAEGGVDGVTGADDGEETDSFSQ
eukprot:TRINITY_DN64926_c0_g1_i1.p1 TRINITY_DN64926_c0_g1~~TRINITY_DN64926_c0_g1_i1.p1  ORF type:complete len:526 (+),score=168.75 TRINITY_DN64926_c0_g1_i1:84-1580(+)